MFHVSETIDRTEKCNERNGKKKEGGKHINMQRERQDKKWRFPKDKRKFLSPEKRERRKENAKKRSTESEETTPYIGTGIISMKKEWTKSPDNKQCYEKEKTRLRNDTFYHIVMTLLIDASLFPKYGEENTK